jgi:hypothetical protein
MRLSRPLQMWYAEDRIGKDRLKGAYAWQTYVQ